MILSIFKCLRKRSISWTRCCVEFSLISANGVDLPQPRWSCKTIRNVAGLKKRRIYGEQLPPGPRYYPADQVTDQNERFIVAELVREQVLEQLHQEVPHSVAVVVEDFEERPGKDLIYIGATIVVERSSQKGIIIGAKGRQLRQIGQAARAEIEHFLDSRVYLELWVKIKKKWRKDDDELRRLGYALPSKK